jgi:hypothetical protein
VTPNRYGLRRLQKGILQKSRSDTCSITRYSFISKASRSLIDAFLLFLLPFSSFEPLSEAFFRRSDIEDPHSLLFLIYLYNSFFGLVFPFVNYLHFHTFFQSAAVIMDDSSELAQIAVLEPILFGELVSTLFANTPFTEQVRVDFEPSLWRAQIPESGDPSTPLLTTYAIYMFYGYLDMDQADHELFWKERSSTIGAQNGFNAWMQSFEPLLSRFSDHLAFTQVPTIIRYIANWLIGRT